MAATTGPACSRCRAAGGAGGQKPEVRHRKEQEAREMHLLEAVVGTSDTAVGVRLFGVRPLHDACGSSTRNSPAGTATSSRKW